MPRVPASPRRAVHGDDGCRFHGSGTNGGGFGAARAFPPGSTVGCGLLLDFQRFASGSTGWPLDPSPGGASVLFFTVDGELAGPAFSVPRLIRRLRRDPVTSMPLPADTPEPQKPLYPVVGCDGSVSLTLNFGAAPFRFDPETAAAALAQPRWAASLQKERMRSAFMIDLDEFDLGDDEDEDGIEDEEEEEEEEEDEDEDEADAPVAAVYGY